MPTYHLAVRLHGAEAVWVDVALQRLHAGRAHRDVDSHKNCTDGPEQRWRKPAELSAPELGEVEDHHMQEVTAHHAQNEEDERERVGCVSVQRRR